MLFAPSGPQGPRRRNRIKAILLTIFIVFALYFFFFADADSPAKSISSYDKANNNYAQRHKAAAQSKAAEEQARPAPRREKELVVASMKRDDTSWLAEHLPDWTRSIYVVDDRHAPLTVARNKGRESMVYLT